VAIWALVAAAAVVRKGGSILGSVWLAVRDMFRYPGSQVRPLFHVLAASCEGEGEVAGGKLVEVRSNLELFPPGLEDRAVNASLALSTASITFRR